MGYHSEYPFIFPVKLPVLEVRGLMGAKFMRYPVGVKKVGVGFKRHGKGRGGGRSITSQSRGGGVSRSSWGRR
eukprot:767537-Hanusia_phi.AAC.3